MSILNMLQFKILAPGTYVVDKGVHVSLAKDDLRRMVVVYNAKGEPKRPAPIVIGHPKEDSPSFGTVGYLHFDQDNGSITAFVDAYKGLSDAMRRAINDGSVGRHSAQFFAPDNPGNPEPNSWYLKHLGFAGPPPTVPTGTLTPDVEFAEYVELCCPMCTDRVTVFAQYSSRPKDPGTIAALAGAYHDEYRSRVGREISFAECVHRVTGSSGKPAPGGQTSRFPEIYMPADSLVPWSKK